MTVKIYPLQTQVSYNPNNPQILKSVLLADVLNALAFSASVWYPSTSSQMFAVL